MPERVPVTDHDCTFIGELTERDFQQSQALVWYFDFEKGEITSRAVTPRYLVRLDNPDDIRRMKGQFQELIPHYEEEVKETIARLKVIDESIQTLSKWKSGQEPLLRRGDYVGPAPPPVTRFSIALEKPLITFGNVEGSGPEKIDKKEEVLEEFKERSTEVHKTLQFNKEQLEAYKKSLRRLEDFEQGKLNFKKDGLCQ